MSAPQEQNVINGNETSLADGIINTNIVRINPYPPSFRRIAANIIDPAIGASTCALGNQR